MRKASPGFTLIELLVVVTIIALLIAILLPSLSRARFNAKVATCSSNYHQWGVAVVAYATAQKGHLPRQDYGGSGLNTWDTSTQFLPAMVPWGVKVELMFCPVRSEHRGSIRTEADAFARFDGFFGSFSLIEHDLWIPRAGGSTIFPRAIDAPYDFPSRISSPTATQLPIISDLLRTEVGQTLETQPGGFTGPYSVGGGHPWNNKVDSTNVLWVDGHVETRLNQQIKLRYSGNWHNYY